MHIRLADADGETTDIIRFSISTYSNSTTVTGHPHKTVPSGLRSVAVTTWGMAVSSLTGLWHLEGKEVSVFADKFVVASPYNNAYQTVSVSNGQITLDKCYVKIHVGLPFISDLETLNVDTAQGETLADKAIIINGATIHCEETRGLFVGGRPPDDDDTDPLQGLNELKLRSDESMEDPVALLTGTDEINLESNSTSNGRVFVRQVDPVPATVLAISPAGLIPVRS